MKNVKIKIPTKHYCGMQKRPGDDLPIGFITPYGTDSAAQKRMGTVDKWVNGYSSTNKQSGIIIDNKPMSGFKLSDTIKRNTGWGRGNVVWRINDPRGFELEISNNNLMQIMMCASIIDTEIISNCVWGREGPENILIPIDSELYKDATKNTVRQKKNVSIRNIQPGNNIILQNGTFGIYLGAFFEILYNAEKTESTLSLSSKKKHYILTKIPEDTWRGGTECILSIASPKIAEIKDESTKTLTETQNIINTASTRGLCVVDGHWWSDYNFIGVSSINNINLTLALKEIDDIEAFSIKYSDKFLSKKLIADINVEDKLAYTTTYNIEMARNKKQSTFNCIHGIMIYRHDLENRGVINKIYARQHQSSFYRFDNSECTMKLDDILASANKWYSLSFDFTDTVTGNEVILAL